VALLLAATAVLAGCATTRQTAVPMATESTVVQRGTGHHSPTPTPTPTTPRPKPSPSALPVAPGAGSLPQTDTQPRTDGTAFKNAVHDIWLAVITGKPDYALPAFFPEKAYAQVKAIYDPDSDWQNRLWYDFTLDLAALRPYVKHNAKLVKVLFPTQYLIWIPAGACYNNVGYWHAPGARVVYEQDGATHSFGIASFISWRGDWYLIHFGAVVRSGAYGIVDDPELGTGYVGPPGNC
jgi:hypothetical protein